MSSIGALLFCFLWINYTTLQSQEPPEIPPIGKVMRFNKNLLLRTIVKIQNQEVKKEEKIFMKNKVLGALHNRDTITPHRNNKIPPPHNNHQPNLIPKTEAKKPFIGKKINGYLQIMELPIIAFYIPWEYQGEIDPYFLKLINYVVDIAIQRGYNYFSLQIVGVKNKISQAIANKHFQFLYGRLVEDTEEHLKKKGVEKKIIILGELVKKSYTKPIIEKNGGFFLIIKAVEKKNRIFLQSDNSIGDTIVEEE